MRQNSTNSSVILVTAYISQRHRNDLSYLSLLNIVARMWTMPEAPRLSCVQIFLIL